MTVDRGVTTDDDTPRSGAEPDTVDTEDTAAATEPTSTRRRDRTGVADRPRENRSPAAQRAIDRRRKRATQRSTATITNRTRAGDTLWATLTRSPGDLLRRVPFAVLVIGILSMGLGLTLWLSTTAAQDSYQLSVARQANQDLLDRRDALKKTFELGDSAPELSDKATALGMIPAKDVPRYVIGPDGKGRVVGEIIAATGTPAPSLDSSTPRNTVVPQPGSSASQPGSVPESAVPGTGVGQAGGPDTAGQAVVTGPIAANVLPQNAVALPSATPRSTDTRTAPGQPAR